jgi:dihydrodipicolinate reductase
VKEVDNATKAIICGVCSGIGRPLTDRIRQDKEIKMVDAVEEKDCPRIGKTINIGDITVTDDLRRNINVTDVVIDFSDNRETNLKHLLTAAAYKRAIIIGTIGFKQDLFCEIGLIRHIIELWEIPCVIASPIRKNQGLPVSASCVQDIFISDVIKAAKWIVGKPANLYYLENVLQLATKDTK